MELQGSETFGDDADVSELATTDSVMHDSDCELVACTFRPKNNEYDQHPDHESDYEFESPAVSPDNDDYTVVTHPHRRSTEFNETNSQPQPPPVGSRGGDGDAAAGPSQSQSNNIGNNDGNDNSDNSGSGSDWDDSGFDRLGYHFCSHCIQCGKCELCGYVLRVRRQCIFLRLHQGIRVTINDKEDIIVMHVGLWGCVICVEIHYEIIDPIMNSLIDQLCIAMTFFL